jgi:hypothetical protein
MGMCMLKLEQIPHFSHLWSDVPYTLRRDVHKLDSRDRICGALGRTLRLEQRGKVDILCSSSTSYFADLGQLKQGHK